MKMLVFMVVALSVAACAAKETKPSLGPGGGVLHSVECLEPVDNCYLEAIGICPNGFNVIEAMEGPRISFSQGFPLPAKGYSLQVECKH